LLPGSPADSQDSTYPGGYSALLHPLKQTVSDYWDNISTSIDEATGVAAFDQDHTTLISN